MPDDDFLAVIPDLHTIMLPSRAILRSWRDQTLPARRTALDDSIALYAAAGDRDDQEFTDMALLGVIADAMQPLEDLAYLSSGWTHPIEGFAHYVKATTYSGRTPTNFWQEAPKWTDDEIDVFAGFAARLPATQNVASLIELTGLDSQLKIEQLALLTKARAASRPRLRAAFTELARDWTQFSPYHTAFKHGGLVLNRTDTSYVDENAAGVHEPMGSPSIAIWHRRSAETKISVDLNLSSDQVIEAAENAGRTAIAIVDRFIAGRLAITEAILFDQHGTVIGPSDEMLLRWSDWLEDEDLTSDEWSHLGTGPRLSMAKRPPAK
jgi:hypothetical protein